MRAHCGQQPADDNAYSADLGRRNRLESRQVRLWQLPPGFGTEPWHAHFRVVIEVTRHTECFDTTTQPWRSRQEKPAYYLATCCDSAQALGQAVRQHWSIENRLHHPLDTRLGEDASRIRRNPGVFALIRHFSINLLRHNGETNLHAALYANALSLDRLLAYRGV